MAEASWKTGGAEIEGVVSGRHGDPFKLLGLHKIGRSWIARAFVPSADTLTATSLDGAALGQLERRDEAGFFEGKVKLKNRQTIRYEATRGNDAWSFIDAYGLGPVLGPLDDYFLAEGTHLRLYDRLGAHPMNHEGADGVHFAVWAPNAGRVSVVGDFNGWDGRRHVMRKRLDTGVWEIFVPGASAGQSYKYELLGADGKLLPLKADPFGFASELRPKNASRIAITDNFIWSDQAYVEARAARDHRRSPMSIYEVHLGSWKRGDGNGFLTYAELAKDLIPYVRDMGFTHIELLPITEHPFDLSWGYQPTGLYAPTARFGDPQGFAHFVDQAHRADIGVILDWVPAHFPTDEHGLARFDGTALYEHEDPRRGFHPDWNTAIYNFGRSEVASYLINNALFWLERYHLDGLRVDAVASMLYLDYSRKAGEWLPNKHGGRENLEAIAFLQRMNHEAYGKTPGAVTIAEESTAFPGVSQPTHAGGLGFGFKWNMGFMHDTLEYLKRDTVHRKHHHHELTFGLLYAFSENFVLPLSHDEVVHGKGSMFERIPQDEWRKFGTLRAFYAFMWAHPGKKLLFMGTEFGQRREFSEARSVDWWQSADYGHRGLQRLVKDLNTVYKENPALWKRDTDPSGFSWIDADDRGGNVFSFLRYDGDGQMIACITNFSSEPRPDHRLGLPTEGVWKEIFNTDAEVYDGTGHIGNLGQVVAQAIPSHGYPASAPVTIPPLGAVWLRFAPVPTEEQPDPDKVAVGVRAAARAASPHRATAEDQAGEEVDVPPEDPVQPAST
ncbi:MAG: 1,4-alpha-glucan branching protein GlgB, partial [Rhizobiales bacterium]|nr:1,4-alpha-glucan branching protein GlgB [Hyphomicrobiales bacterium]